MKRGAVLGLAFAPVVERGGGDVGMTEPFLDLGDIRLVRKRIGRRRRPQRMHTQPVGVSPGIAVDLPINSIVTRCLYTRFEQAASSGFRSRQYPNS